MVRILFRLDMGGRRDGQRRIPAWAKEARPGMRKGIPMTLTPSERERIAEREVTDVDFLADLENTPPEVVKELRRVRAERDEKARFAQGYYGEASEGWSKFRAAERKVALLREALKPFAMVAKEWVENRVIQRDAHAAIAYYEAALEAWERTQEVGGETTV